MKKIINNIRFRKVRQELVDISLLELQGMMLIEAHGEKENISDKDSELRDIEADVDIAVHVADEVSQEFEEGV